MANVPSGGFAEWATNTVFESVTINGSPVSVNNKVEPTQAFKDSGELARQNLPRPYLNYTLNLTDLWIQNLDTRTSLLGKIELTSDATRTVTDYANEFGGTWTSHGSDTISGLTVYLFERSA
jgi:hypothetical protein